MAGRSANIQFMGEVMSAESTLGNICVGLTVATGRNSAAQYCYCIMEKGQARRSLPSTVQSAGERETVPVQQGTYNQVALLPFSLLNPKMKF